MSRTASVLSVRGRLIVSEKMRAKLFFRDETESLTIDRLDRAGGKLAMQRDGQDLRRPARGLALQFGVAAAGRGDQEPESMENPKDLPGRQAFKSRHYRKDCPRMSARSSAIL